MKKQLSPERTIYANIGCSPVRYIITKKNLMGQSLVKDYMHIIFSTKYRQPLIYEPVEHELHAYLGGICKNLECHAIIIGRIY